ncbi:MAG: hypothetical protein JOS17DRAFT_729486 [Linnemannia elongata]|nr:MAG: hypothetical protein JOS17DRAFT_729486 [Linnemannia elongata]
MSKWTLFVLFLFLHVTTHSSPCVLSCNVNVDTNYLTSSIPVAIRATSEMTAKKKKNAEESHVDFAAKTADGPSFFYFRVSES